MNEYEEELPEDYLFTYRFLKTKGHEIARVVGSPSGDGYFIDREADLRELIKVMRKPKYRVQAERAIRQFRMLDQIGQERELESFDAHRNSEDLVKIPA